MLEPVPNAHIELFSFISFVRTGERRLSALVSALEEIRRKIPGGSRGHKSPVSTCCLSLKEDLLIRSKNTTIPIPVGTVFRAMHSLSQLLNHFPILCFLALSSVLITEHLLFQLPCWELEKSEQTQFLLSKDSPYVMGMPLIILPGQGVSKWFSLYPITIMTPGLPSLFMALKMLWMGHCKGIIYM